MCEWFLHFRGKINIRACCSMSHSAEKRWRETLTASWSPAPEAENAGASHCPANTRMRWWREEQKITQWLRCHRTQWIKRLLLLSVSLIDCSHESILGRTGQRYSAAVRPLREVKMKRGSVLIQQKMKRMMSKLGNTSATSLPSFRWGHSTSPSEPTWQDDSKWEGRTCSPISNCTSGWSQVEKLTSYKADSMNNFLWQTTCLQKGHGHCKRKQKTHKRVNITSNVWDKYLRQTRMCFCPTHTMFLKRPFKIRQHSNRNYTSWLAVKHYNVQIAIVAEGQQLMALNN